jgi:hypothetical protein
VTAEFAVTVPAVLLVLAACLGGLRVGIERLRVVDAAAQAARLAAVGDPVARPVAAVGAEVVAVRHADETVCISLHRDVRVLGVPLPVDATGCALAGIAP